LEREERLIAQQHCTLKSIVAFGALVLALGFTSGCNSKDNVSDVMAKVNGRKILTTEVDKYYRNQTAGAPQQPTGEQSTSLKLSILRELIDNEILM
jgi:hypothetical protein